MNRMNKHPKISIITPSFNQANYLENTIKSVLNQNYPNLEYIIIDGGSTDGSVDIIKKYQDYLFYWISEKDEGQSQAINKGFKKASGKYINWLNSDDVLLENALFTLSHYLESNQSVGLVYGNVIYINAKNEVLYQSYEIPYSQKITIYGTNYIPQPAALYRREIIEKIGCLDENLHYCMDHEYWLRMYHTNIKIGNVKNNIAGYRLHRRSKGVSHAHIRIKKERYLLKLKYGRSFSGKMTEALGLKALAIYFRVKRKIIQYKIYRKSDIIPTSIKLKYFTKVKKLV